jgi:hypothetical protein
VPPSDRTLFCNAGVTSARTSTNARWFRSIRTPVEGATRRQTDDRGHPTFVASRQFMNRAYQKSGTSPPAALDHESAIERIYGFFSTGMSVLSPQLRLKRPRTYHVPFDGR